jgi:cytochrome c556
MAIARAALALAMSAALLILGASNATAGDQETIKYRQMIMKQLEAEATVLGMIVSGQIPPDALGAEARSIANAAKVALKAFEPNVPGGEAKPAVWTKWDDFSQRMQAFAQKSEELAKVADTGNVAQVTEMMVDALSCKDCHDLYRDKKK